MGLKVVILAAGKGKRMTSSVPKVMHTIGGKPMLQHVVETAEALEPDAIFVVYGNGGETIRRSMASLDVTWVEQKQQLGTGHAVQQVLPFLQESDRVLVLYGDVPLTSVRLLKQLIQDSPINGLGLVVTELENPTGFGRIIRNEVGNIVAIVEHKDAKDWQLEINEINTGIITAPASFLQKEISHIENHNSQEEYYLTDVVALAVESGIPVGGVIAHVPSEVLGVNDRWQQVKLERYYQYKQVKKLALMGVHIADHQRLDIRGNIKVGLDTSLDINVVLEGDVEIGKNCVIGSGVILKNVTLGDDVTVLPHSIIEGADIRLGAVVGPFARIRPGTVIEEHAKVGNFVEIKKTTLGRQSKASHLSYLGDAVIENNVNIGAGTITCNYDGVNKHTTQIQQGAFIGSNSSLVAPITIGKNATVAAGSTITRNAPGEKLIVERAPQTVIEGWKRPIKKQHKVDDV